MLANYLVPALAVLGMVSAGEFSPQCPKGGSVFKSKTLSSVKTIY